MTDDETQELEKLEKDLQMVIDSPQYSEASATDKLQMLKQMEQGFNDYLRLKEIFAEIYNKNKKEQND